MPAASSRRRRRSAIADPPGGGADLADTLPPLSRLALAYAPARARGATLALLAFDTRLAGIVRAASEPMMAQLRLAWWREQLRVPVERWPAGEPLLAALRVWAGESAALAGLVDGWEAMVAAPPLGAEAITALARARGAAFAALARLLDAPAATDAACRAGTEWALADIAARLSRADERATARMLAAAADPRRAPLPRALRPLAVLHGLAIAARRRDEPLAANPRVLLTSARIGLLGR